MGDYSALFTQRARCHDDCRKRFFGRLAAIPSDGIPYPIFSYAALVPWSFFATGLSSSSNSLVGSANLLKKGRESQGSPIATVLSGVIDFVLAFILLLGMMLFYGIGT